MDIHSELNLIRKSIEALHTELSLTKGEIRKLRLAIQNKKREKPKEATLVSPMWCYEWDQMTIDLDPMTWKRIRNGELVIARGRGTRLDNPLPNGDDCFQWDYWTFNGILGLRQIERLIFAGNCPDAAILLPIRRIFCGN